MSDTINTVKPLCTRLWTPILPTVFSDTLSYMEQLSQFSKKLNELIESYNQFAGEYENYVQQQLAPYQSQLDALQNQLNSVVSEINDNFDLFKTETNKKIDAQNDVIDDFKDDINGQFKTYTDETDKKLAAWKSGIEAELGEEEQKIYDHVTSELLRIKTELTTEVALQISYLRKLIDQYNNVTKSWVEGRLQQFLNEIPQSQVLVINPTSGTIDSLQQTLYDMYDYYREDGLTAQEYDELMLTAEEYDNKELSAYEYDFYSKRVLEKDSRFYMFSPVNGKYEYYQTVIYELAALHMLLAMTAEEYDALELTAETFDGKEITAYDYDWNAKQLLVA